MSSPSIVQDETRPFVLTAMIKNAQQLTAVDDAAASAGLTPGMTLSHARALVPDVQTAPADPEGDRFALEKLADWCGRYSPSFGVDDSAADCGPDDHGLWVDATGCAHLFGGEEAMLADLGRRLDGFCLRHRLGLADTPGAAWALARYHPTTPIVGGHESKDALFELPVAGLRLSPETGTLLRRLGLKTIGQLDAIPRVALAKRFSSKETYESVLLRLDQLFGRHEELLTPRRPKPVYRVEQAFLDPLIEPEALAHGLEHLATALCRELAKANEGVERLAFLAFRVDGDVKTLKVGTSLATHDSGHIIRLFTEKLENIDPGFGIEKLALHAERTAPIEKRQKTLQGGAADVTDLDERFNQLIDRLANRLGPDAVQVVIPFESHVPERAAGTVPALTLKNSAVRVDAQKEAAGPSCPSCPRPSCLLLRPEPIKALAEVPDGPPLRFTWRRVTRRIVRSEGPERIAPEWVGAADSVDLAAATRDYYRVEDDQGQRYWLFRQGLYDRYGYPDDDADIVDATSRIGWFIHGLFG
ncbi:MAG: DNA polymerase Y family protein [Pseudomonadota bacterium]